MKFIIKQIDNLLSNKADALFIYWGGGLTVVITWSVALIAMINTAAQLNVLFVENYPGMGWAISLKFYNTLYLVGLLINIIAIIIYVKLTTKDLSHPYSNILDGLKHFTLYTFLGFGGINLVIWVIGILYLIIGGLVLLLSAIGVTLKSGMGDLLENFFISLQNRKK